MKGRPIESAILAKQNEALESSVVTSDLEKALDHLETAEANLAKLERIWQKLVKLQPKRSFTSEGQERVEYDELVSAYQVILVELPKIDGFALTANPRSYEEVLNLRLGASEVGEIDGAIRVEETLAVPGRQLREYRSRLNRHRRSFIRPHLEQLITRITTLLATFPDPPTTTDRGWITNAEFQILVDAVGKIDTLLGSTFNRSRRWQDLNRHLHFRQSNDLRDIITQDWPETREELEHILISDADPIPKTIDDLAQIQPPPLDVPVPNRLNWSHLTDEDFERLIFCLISTTPGYENPDWLTKTHAPDRGRDLNVTHRIEDNLGGVRYERVIIQCRHQQASINLDDVSKLNSQVDLWQPPTVDELIVATTSRFTTDAIDWIERNNHSARRRILMWSESRLERLFARRPDLIAEFGLRDKPRLQDAVAAETARYEALDPRFRAEIVADKHREVISFFAKEHVEAKGQMLFRGDVASINEKIRDLFERGIPVEFAPGDIHIDGSPLLAQVLGQGGRLQIFLQHDVILVLEVQANGEVIRTLDDIPGEFSGGAKELRFEPSATGCPIVPEATLTISEDSRSVAATFSMSFQHEAWEGCRILRLPYFEVIQAFLVELSTGELWVRFKRHGTVLYQSPVQADVAAFAQELAPLFDLIQQAREVSRRLAIDPPYSRKELIHDRRRIAAVAALLSGREYRCSGRGHFIAFTIERQQFEAMLNSTPELGICLRTAAEPINVLGVEAQVGPHEYVLTRVRLEEASALEPIPEGYVHVRAMSHDEGEVVYRPIVSEPPATNQLRSLAKPGSDPASPE